jgi:hypothetical protein
MLLRLRALRGACSGFPKVRKARGAVRGLRRLLRALAVAVTLAVLVLLWRLYPKSVAELRGHGHLLSANSSDLLDPDSFPENSTVCNSTGIPPLGGEPEARWSKTVWRKRTVRRKVRPVHLYVVAAGWRARYSFIMAFNSILHSRLRDAAATSKDFLGLEGVYSPMGPFPASHGQGSPSLHELPLDAENRSTTALPGTRWRNLDALNKSLRPLHLHIVADAENAQEFSGRFRFGSRTDQVEAFFYDPQLVAEKCGLPQYDGAGEGPKNKENLGLVMSKLCLDSILPASVDLVVSLDVDMLTIDNIEKLWKQGIVGEDDPEEEVEVLVEEPDDGNDSSSSIRINARSQWEVDRGTTNRGVAESSTSSPARLVGEFPAPYKGIGKPRLSECDCTRTGEPNGIPSPPGGVSETRRRVARELGENPPFGVTVEMGGWYRDHSTNSSRSRLLACGLSYIRCTGVNTGVLVQDLRILRKVSWTALWQRTIVDDRVTLELRDQGIFYIIFLSFFLLLFHSAYLISTVRFSFFLRYRRAKLHVLGLSTRLPRSVTIQHAARRVQVLARKGAERARPELSAILGSLRVPGRGEICDDRIGVAGGVQGWRAARPRGERDECGFRGTGAGDCSRQRVDVRGFHYAALGRCVLVQRLL